MIIIGPTDLKSVYDSDDNEYHIWDHIDGFDQNLNNRVLFELNSRGKPIKVYTEYFFDQQIRDLYPNLDLRLQMDMYRKSHITHALTSFKIHPENSLTNFLCCFNGKPHVGRKLLVACLKKFKLFDEETCTKAFTYDPADIDNHVRYLDPSGERLYRKFFDHSSVFANLVLTHHYNDRPTVEEGAVYDVQYLVPLISRSFVQVVSETLSESYYPFVTEKFIFSVINRGLFVAFAQPGWHQHLESMLGFRKFDKIFDYGFDSILNPVERLVSLITMLSKFANLSRDDWQDLIEIEKDTIAHNYDLFVSGEYWKKVERYA